MCDNQDPKGSPTAGASEYMDTLMISMEGEMSKVQAPLCALLYMRLSHPSLPEPVTL